MRLKLSEVLRTAGVPPPVCLSAVCFRSTNQKKGKKKQRKMDESVAWLRGRFLNGKILETLTLVSFILSN